MSQATKDMAADATKQTLLSASVPHESAQLHVSGDADYVDDIPELAGTVYAVLGLSEHAHATIESMDLSAVKNYPGVVAVLTAKDIPGPNDCGPIINDDPILADGLVQYVGQAIFLVLAENYNDARRAARLGNIKYSPLEATFSPAKAKEKNLFVMPELHLSQGHPQAVLESSDYQLQGNFIVGGQEQFYLEGQIAYAVPKEGDCIHLWCSTQHPTEMQHLVAHALKLQNNQVVCEMRRMGGGFGGKESQSAIFACAAAIGAQYLNRPVKLRVDRDDDMSITGKRHAFEYVYDVGFNQLGVINAVKIEMVIQSGFSADLTGPVATRAVCHFDNAYYLSDVDIKAYCAKTNTQSNTAFRGFGGPQGAIAIEYIIDDIARELEVDSLQVRRANFYGTADRNITPYQQKVEDNVIVELVDQLVEESDYVARREAIKKYNASSVILKKGISLTPLKFGISFNVVHFNQAGSLVHIYTDGSILVNHGGTEMGQGLNTKIAQVVAHELGVDVNTVRSTATDTSKVANTSATAASTGTDLNAKAAQNAVRIIKKRLQELVSETHGVKANEVVFSDGNVKFLGDSCSFKELVQLAYESRVQLWSDGFYTTPKLHWDMKTLTGRPFYYFSYGAAVSEVVIDTLTGESKLLRADILHDAGNAINPAIDIGQIEGAFIQGMGWLTMEELKWNDAGRLTTHAPSTYKIPAVSDCPAELHTRLFKNLNAEDTIMRSKAVGEPPLLLPFSVFFAIRDAIASIADYKINPVLNAPATCEEILNSVDVLKLRHSKG